MARQPLFANPEAAHFAWARYKRLMRFMLLLTVGVVVVGLTAVYRNVGMVSPQIFIATAAAIGFAMLLMAALMGLVFMSSSYQEYEDAQKEAEELARKQAQNAATNAAEAQEAPNSSSTAEIAD